MLASDSMTFARFSGGSASLSGSKAATTSSVEKALARFSTFSPEIQWRSRTRSNRYAECWFDINWRKRGNDEIRNHPVLEQRR